MVAEKPIVEKKPVGWFAKRVNELDEQVQLFSGQLEDVEKRLESVPQLTKLLASPIVAETTAFEKRMRRMEQTWDAIARELRDISNRVYRVESEMAALNRRQTRGA